MMMTMMKSLGFVSFLFASVGVVMGQGQPPYPSETTPFEYFDSTTNSSLLGHVAMPDVNVDGDGPFPAVIIIPDWDGVDEYEQIRATMVAKEWGFVGFAADIYGVMPQLVENITERRDLATLYRDTNPELFEQRIKAAIDAVNSMENVESGNIALFGYCFGGTGVLQYGFYGNDDVNAIVSFHGGFNSFSTNSTDVFTPRVLILSGGDDNTPEQIMDMEMLLDSVQAPWEITRYEGIEHAFTVWFDERYDEDVDMLSWNSAGNFILEAFGITQFETALPDSADTIAVNYTGSIDGLPLMGHLAIPDDTWVRPLPAIVILPDWDGVNLYEQERATALANLGYYAMAADIFGADNQTVESTPERIELVTKYRTDPNLYVARIQDAIAQVKQVDGVDPDEIGVIGYCFGGSGAVLYAFFDGSEAEVVVPFHGSFGELPPVLVDEIEPYILLLSGGNDGQFGNQTLIESVLESGDADWEITRYAGLGHGYTVPSSPDYNIVGDARSWESMLAAFTDSLTVPLQVGGTPAPVMGDNVTDSTAPSMSPIMMDSTAPAMMDSTAPAMMDSTAPAMMGSTAPAMMDSTAPAPTDGDSMPPTDVETSTMAPSESDVETSPPVPQPTFQPPDPTEAPTATPTPEPTTADSSASGFGVFVAMMISALTLSVLA